MNFESHTLSYLSFKSYTIFCNNTKLRKLVRELAHEGWMIGFKWFLIKERLWFTRNQADQYDLQKN